jgi:hypothetical protein
MSKSIRWISLAVLSLMVSSGLLVAALSLLGAQEQPPCRACVQPTSELPRVSVCELASSRENLARKMVRVTARFQNDAGQLFLKDGICSVRTGFAPPTQACQGARRRLEVACGVDQWYDGSASVQVVGSIGTVPDDNYFKGEEGFTISCLEKVKTEPATSQRIRFAIGRLLPK